MAQIGFLLAKQSPHDSMPTTIDELTSSIEKHFGFKPEIGDVLMLIRDKMIEIEKTQAYNRAMKLI